MTKTKTLNQNSEGSLEIIQTLRRNLNEHVKNPADNIESMRSMMFDPPGEENRLVYLAFKKPLDLPDPVLFTDQVAVGEFSYLDVGVNGEPHSLEIRSAADRGQRYRFFLDQVDVAWLPVPINT